MDTCPGFSMSLKGGLMPKTTVFDYQAYAGLTKHLGGLAATEELIRLCEISSDDEVLEVGCGVGQTASLLAKRIGCRVVGVDLAAVDELGLAQVSTFQADLGEEGLAERVLGALGGPADIVLSDAAPKLTGIRVTDRAREEELLESVAALLARKAGRPVKVVMTRAGTFLATGPNSGTVIRVKMGATRDGRITAAQAELFYEAGAYPGAPVGSGAGVLFAPYDIPHGRVDGYDVVVSKPRVSTYRAPGATPVRLRPLSSPSTVPIVCVPWPSSSKGTGVSSQASCQL